MLHDLTGVLEESVAKMETAKATISTHPSAEGFLEQIRRKCKPADDAVKRTKMSTTFTMVLNDPQLRSKSKFPTWNFFALLWSVEMENDGDNDENTERQQHHAPSRIPFY
jgi:hypothetical protein